MAFKNYEGMLNELLKLDIDSEYVQLFLENADSTGVLNEYQLNEIVRLYNIHCMPTRYENFTDPRPKGKGKNNGYRRN